MDLPAVSVPRGPVTWPDPVADLQADLDVLRASEDRLQAAAEGTCDGCRRGHYAVGGGGGLSNFPCTTEGCTCWFCGPVVTPAQAAGRRLALTSWTDPLSRPLEDVLRASGGLCAPAELHLYDLVDRAPWTHADPSWWWDVDVGAWLFPRLAATRLALREARRRLTVAARVLHHGYGWKPPTDGES